MVSTGIDVVRNRIKGFAQKKVTLPPGRHKIVILDEADRFESIIHLDVAMLISVNAQHDFWSPTSPTTHDGNLLQHDTVRIRLQSVQQDHRATPIAMRHSKIRSSNRRAGGPAPCPDRGSRKD